MDESKRDIYNRFGEQSLQFDPRQDEIKLLSSVVTTYLYWGVLSYIVTIPKSSKMSTNWILIVLIAIFVLEVFLCLTETAVPDFGLPYLTEQELLLFVHSFFPFILVSLKVLADCLYVDVDQYTIDALSAITTHQKVKLIIVVILPIAH